MTIQGAMNELINLLKADDIPIYYKGSIKKVIETIDDYIDGKDDTDCVFCEHCADVFWDYTNLIYMIHCNEEHDPWDRPCEYFKESDDE